MASCPKPTQDIELNLKNRQKAIDKVGYGPLNPNEENADFWEKKAGMWDVSISDAKKQKCGNCAAFNRTKEMLDCIGKGMGDEDDSWDAIEAGQLGYCEALDFKCAASRTCDAWIDGNAKSSGAKVSTVDLYLTKVARTLDLIEGKADKIRTGSFVEWNASGGKARGRVEHVMKKGTLGVPDSKFSIDADPNDPAVLIRIWRKNSDGDWEETDTLVGHKMSTLSLTDRLSGKHEYVDGLEEKVTRRVRDAEYWGVPVGTPIAPGMKPIGPKSPAGRARAMSGGASGGRSGGSRGSVEISAPKKPSSKPSGRRSPSSMSDSDLMDEIDRVDAEMDKFPPGPKGKDADKYNELNSNLRDLMGEAMDRGWVDDDGNFNAKAPKKKDKDKSKGESKFDTFIDEDTGLEFYKPAKAEDFSVDAVASELKKVKKDGRKDGAGTLEDPKDVGSDVELAHQLLAEGQHIRMSSSKDVSTLIDKLREIAEEADKKGEKAPDYDLCKVSVPQTNLFCVESKGIPRTLMPQFKGDPHDGSFAYDQMQKRLAEVQARIDAGETDKDGKPLKLPKEADIEPEFRDLLDKLGIKTELKTVKAADLKATQDNLVGTKVAGMAGAMREGKIPDAPIFVTRDGYIIDGHHRWAAKVALDIEDGELGDVEMPVEVIDGDIGYILDLANSFADIGGIKRKGMGADADGVGGKKPKGKVRVVRPGAGKETFQQGVGTVIQNDNTKSAKSDCKPCQGNVY